MIKKLFSTGINAKYIHIALLILRLAVAAFMLTHGWPKLSRLLAGGEIRFSDPLGIGVVTSFTLVVFAEFFCSILVGLGLGTRLAVIPLIITMSVVVFIAQGSAAFGRKELPIMFLIIYVFLLISGSGKYSVDGLISKAFRKVSK